MTAKKTYKLNQDQLKIMLEKASSKSLEGETPPHVAISRHIGNSTMMSLASIASKIGVAPSTLERWTVGITEPNATAIRRLSQVLGVTADNLIGNVEPTSTLSLRELGYLDALTLDNTLDVGIIRAMANKLNTLSGGKDTALETLLHHVAHVIDTLKSLRRASR